VPSPLLQPKIVLAWKNQDYSFHLLCIIVVTGLAAARLPSANAAVASPEKKRTRTGTATLNSSTVRADGQNIKDTAVTGPGGKSAERVAATNLNGDGTGTRTVEVTKPDGTKESRTETFTVSETNP